MTPFHQPPMSDAPGDPLERLVEAFVDQSVPEGPDADVQRRMVALMRAADSQAPIATTRREPVAIVDAPLNSGPRYRALQAVLALAAAGLFGAVLLPELRRPNAANPLAANPGGEVAVAPPEIELHATPEVAVSGSDSRLALEVGQLLQRYLDAHDGRLPDRETAQVMLAEWLGEHPELADSRTWQFAHEQLAAALERPKVLTVGVGLIGAIPWTAYGRF
jgi:hypothetical protein